jgi:dihydrolipoamide dehydrogenase
VRDDPAERPATASVDVVVVGAGPAGLVAALRSADLGARTALVTHAELGGMAANDGPVPVRTLAHAARLLRDARQLPRYGIEIAEPHLDYKKLLARVREVVASVQAHASLRAQIYTAGVAVHEQVGAARFADPFTIEAENGFRISGRKIILCTGGTSRRLPIPGFELTATHSDAWSLESVPPTLLVVGAGATGAQVASIFNAFGARVELFEAGSRILPTEDEDVSVAVAESFRKAGIVVREAFGRVDAFEKAPAGVRLVFSKNGARQSVEAALAVIAVGWAANTAGLGVSTAGVETDRRGFICVDAHLRTTAPHVFAAGDVTGRLMLATQAMHDGFVAATNAVLGPKELQPEIVSPIGSFTDPEYAQAGMTEANARTNHDVIVAKVGYDSSVRTIIDGRDEGFCKLIVDRPTRAILGCHVVGERAVDIVQTAAVAIAAGMRVDELARVPLSFPTYTGILGRAAVSVAHRLSLDAGTSRLAESL